MSDATNEEPVLQRRGLVMINTGAGKGKTTAALGVAMRALGSGMRVLVMQFLKGSWHYGELDAATENFGGALEIKQLGRGFVKVGGAETDPEDLRLVHEGWQQCIDAMQSGEWDVVVLDEILYAIGYGMLDADAVAAAVKEKAGDAARDPDGKKRAGGAGGAGGYGDGNARGEARVYEGDPGAARD